MALRCVALIIACFSLSKEAWCTAVHSHSKICLKHRGQRGCDTLEPLDKLLGKTTQPDKLSNFMNRGGRRPTSNDLDLFGVHVYCVSIDDVAAEGYSTLEESGFIDAGK